MSVYVFLGPTMPVDHARAILDAAYLPPAAAGDICKLVLGPSPVKAIALIDGLFQQMPAVWHKEILFALSHRIPVYGSSSMGALRAAELAPFGMVGVGHIFEAFRDGVYEDDDEVAVIHGLGEHQYIPLSDPMVNLRHGLDLAVASGSISETTKTRLTGLAKSWFYPDRSWKKLLREAPLAGVPEAEIARLRELVERVRPDMKRADAELLLHRVKDDDLRGFAFTPPTFDFEPTKYWQSLVAAMTPAI